MFTRNHLCETKKRDIFLDKCERGPTGQSQKIQDKKRKIHFKENLETSVKLRGFK